MPRRPRSLRAVTRALEQDLLRAFGPIAGGAELHRMLGFKTGAAFRQAKRRGRLPVPVFALEGRRGTFGYVKDIAAWLAAQGVRATQPGVRAAGPKGRQPKRFKRG